MKADPSRITHRVSPSERVYLSRERARMTQPQMANRFGLTTDEWREYETGEKNHPPKHIMVNGRVMNWELMKLWRRRHEWSVKDFAVRIGLSHVTLIHHERGRGDWTETFTWWERHRNARS